MTKALQPVFMLAVFAFCSIAVAHDDPLETELHELLDELLAGASTDDAAMHDRFWAEDLVYTSSSGERFGKAEIMGRLGDVPADEDAAGPAYRGEDVEIRIFDDLAVITFRLVAEMPDGTTSEYFNTGVLTKREGNWQAFTWQATRIPEDSE